MATFDRAAHVLPPTAAATRLPLEGGNVWYYAAHPGAWDVVEIDGATRWVPKMRKLPFKKGANGINNDGAIGAYMQWLTANGWQVVGNNPNPSHWLHYADMLPGRGGNVMIDVWTTIHQPSANKVKLRREPEQVEEFNRWRARLVDEGVVKAPEPITIDDLIDDYEQQRVKRLMGKDQKPIIVERLEQARAELARMRAASLTAVEPKAVKRGR